MFPIKRQQAKVVNKATPFPIGILSVVHHFRQVETDSLDAGILDVKFKRVDLTNFVALCLPGFNVQACFKQQRTRRQILWSLQVACPARWNAFTSFMLGAVFAPSRPSIKQMNFNLRQDKAEPYEPIW